MKIITANLPVRKVLRSITPRWLTRFRQKVITERFDRAATGKDATSIFELIYRDQLWGSSKNGEFYSGTGSHDEKVIGPYVDAVIGFLRQFQEPPTVVDFGCGDFNVGSRIRPHCGGYRAYDIVAPLVARNRSLYAHLDVDFQVASLSEATVAPARILFLRQVLQHLSNAQIQAALKLITRFEVLILTEHLPDLSGFTPNLDQPAGIGVRLVRTPISGVVLTEAPFNMRVLRQQTLCRVSEGHGAIVTTAYWIAPSKKPV